MSTYEWSVVTGLETRAPPTSEVSLFIVLYPLEKKLSILGWGKNFFRAAKEVDYRRVFPQLCSPKEVFSSTNFINFTILQMNQCRQLTICWFKDLIMVKLIWNKFYQLYSILVMDTYCYWCSEASLYRAQVWWCTQLMEKIFCFHLEDTVGAIVIRHASPWALYCVYVLIYLAQQFLFLGLCPQDKSQIKCSVSTNKWKWDKWHYPSNKF